MIASFVLLVYTYLLLFLSPALFAWYLKLPDPPFHPSFSMYVYMCLFIYFWLSAFELTSHWYLIWPWNPSVVNSLHRQPKEDPVLSLLNWGCWDRSRKGILCLSSCPILLWGRTELPRGERMLNWWATWEHVTPSSMALPLQFTETLHACQGVLP